MKAASGAQVFIHGDDAPFLYDPGHFFDLYYAPVMKAIGNDLRTARQTFLEDYAEPLVPDQKLDDGDVIDGGSGVKLHVFTFRATPLGRWVFIGKKRAFLLPVTP